MHAATAKNVTWVGESHGQAETAEEQPDLMMSYIRKGLCIAHSLPQTVMLTTSLYREGTRWVRIFPRQLPVKIAYNMCSRHRIGTPLYSRAYDRYNARSISFNECPTMLSTMAIPTPCRHIKTQQATFQGFDEAPERIDNISDTALRAFQEHYSDDTLSPRMTSSITSTGSYTHPVTESSSQYDLSKMIPRIPYAPDFHAFAEAGQAACRPPPQLRNMPAISRSQR